ncbi:acetamidase/formamidase family protein [Pseudaminobacter soli (ex Li et al. 2025)]|uniref:acetamidase/formamidase family protein n=1 Tax=Pseudaminobacter soli (ex Li et al. 2025) TaxID=1295366 RepID=UPI001FE2346F|nr:acetamidase/formamidase family protein [Mesorhizobium soli]
MTIHHLAANPETVRRGTLDGRFPPVLTVVSGDTVTIQTLSGHEIINPPAELGHDIPPAVRAVLSAVAPGMGPHIISGPVAIAGAEPGDMLEVRIDRIEPSMDWGFCLFSPLGGTLPGKFQSGDLRFIPIDMEKRTCALPWGPELPLAPFFGIMATAPRLAYGTLSTKEPRDFGGNMDNRELVEGSTLFLPVWVPGANFMVGDGHGIQGDGEVCGTALETSLNGTFTFILHKGGGIDAPRLKFPRAETPTHYLTMGMNEDLDAAMRDALDEMIDLICERTGWSPGEAYMSCSFAVDFRVTQTVNGQKGVHGMLRKGLLF